MTPKEKAIELVDKMYGVTDYQAKQSALIAVDEIIITCAFYDYKTKKYFEHCSDYDDNFFVTYWQEVRREIENL